MKTKPPAHLFGAWGFSFVWAWGAGHPAPGSTLVALAAQPPLVRRSGQEVAANGWHWHCGFVHLQLNATTTHGEPLLCSIHNLGQQAKLSKEIIMTKTATAFGNISLTTVNEDTRKGIHAAFNAWMLSCNEADYSLFLKVKEWVAQGRPCSILQVVLVCSQLALLRQQLPATLRERLQAANLLPV